MVSVAIRILVSYGFLQMEAILIELNFPVDVMDKFKEEKVNCIVL